MGIKLGLEAKAYFGNALIATADDSGVEAVTWTEMGNVTDVTQSLEKSEADVTTRANNGWRQNRGTLKDGSVEFKMNWDTEDAGFAAILAAWLANNEISLAFMDGTITTTGSNGLASNFDVINITREEPLENAIQASVTVKPSSKTHWYEKAA